jgi:hypothetical protein
MGHHYFSVLAGLRCNLIGILTLATRGKSDGQEE